MKIEKAIQILHLITDTPPSGANPDFVDALKLGIEALKRIKYTRDANITMNYKELPGETEGGTNEHS